MRPQRWGWARTENFARPHRPARDWCWPTDSDTVRSDRVVRQASNDVRGIRVARSSRPAASRFGPGPSLSARKNSNLQPFAPAQDRTHRPFGPIKLQPAALRFGPAPVLLRHGSPVRLADRRVSTPPQNARVEGSAPSKRSAACGRSPRTRCWAPTLGQES